MKHRLTEQSVPDMDDAVISQYLGKYGNSLDGLKPEQVVRGYKQSKWILGAFLGFIIAGAWGVIGFAVYTNWQNTRHDKIEYYADDFGVRRTARWRYDSKCRKPIEIGYTSISFTPREMGDWPELLIPESYRNWLDEFAGNKGNIGPTPP